MRHENLKSLTDEELLASLKALAGNEKENLIAILRRLVELDQRELAERIGRPSLFLFLVRDLHYSETEAWWRIRAARAAARNPSLYRLIQSGRLTLCAVAMLEPHLRRGNARELIRKAIGMSTRSLEAMLDCLTPEKPPADRVRHIAPPPLQPASSGEGSGPDLFSAPPAATAEAATDASSDVVAPPAPPPPPRVHFSFTAGESLLKDVERAKEVLRHKHPAGRLEDIFGEALDALLERADPERRLRRKAEREARSRQAEPARVEAAASATPQAAAPAEEGGPSRRIPQAVRDAVWLRDGGACAYVGADGSRCGERAWLEYDHVLPWALGGRSDQAANVRLLCRAHNRAEARRLLGPVLPGLG